MGYPILLKSQKSQNHIFFLEILNWIILVHRNTMATFQPGAKGFGADLTPNNVFGTARFLFRRKRALFCDHLWLATWAMTAWAQGLFPPVPKVLLWRAIYVAHKVLWRMVICGQLQKTTSSKTQQCPITSKPMGGAQSWFVFWQKSFGWSCHLNFWFDFAAQEHNPARMAACLSYSENGFWKRIIIHVRVNLRKQGVLEKIRGFPLKFWSFSQSRCI